jgi:hypothetical protein
MLQHDDETSKAANRSTKSILTNIVSAALQYDFMESMAWHAHHLKDEVMLIGSLWISPSLHHQSFTDSTGQLNISEDLCQSPTTESILYCQAGDNFAARMKWDEAICAWEKSLNYYQPVKEENCRLVATLFTKIGIAYYIKDDIYMAYESFQQALNIQEASLDPGDEDISVTVKNLWIVRVRMKEVSMENPLSRELLMLHVMNSLLFKLTK